MNNSRKGVSIYLVVVMISVLLAIALGLTSIIISGAKMSSDLSYSIKAFHAADTGIERALYQIKKQGTCDTPITDNFGAVDYNYEVIITHTGGGTCQDPNTLIESLGQYITTKRRIEASY